MTENQISAIEIEDVETDEVLTLTEIVTEIVTETFGTDVEISPYKIATIINKVFTATMTDKQIPTQMMYTYDKNGMIVKGKKSVKRYTKDEVITYVNKYTSKHVTI